MTRLERFISLWIGEKRERNVQAMHKCLPTTFCLSSVDFIFTIERAAEVSDANKT